jgi:N-acetylneuraminic acid mutarotase
MRAFGNFILTARMPSILALFISTANAALFHTTGSMGVALFADTTTVLPDGKVLAAGGANAFSTDLDISASVTNRAEIYDPSHGNWTATDSLTFGRAFHTATLLTNGMVLVAGGMGILPHYAGAFSSAELFSPALGLWMITGYMNAPRENHTATLLPDGQVLVAGGYNVNTGVYPTVAELYNPARQKWTVTGDLNFGRENPTATLLQSGKVLLAGGQGLKGCLSSAELYDPSNGTWTSTGDLITARDYHTATLLPDGKVLVTGGIGNTGILSSAEIYDPSNGTWTATGNLKIARQWHTATLLPDGKVLVVGGFGYHLIDPVSSAELYDPADGKWTAAGSLNTGRFFHTANLLPGGKILIAGGVTYNIVDFKTLSKAELSGAIFENTGTK